MVRILAVAVPLAVYSTAASTAPGIADLKRARTKRPGNEFRGRNANETSAALNSHLQRTECLQTRPCSDHSSEQLRETLRWLQRHADDSFQELYEASRDVRRRGQLSLSELEDRWRLIDEWFAISKEPDLAAVMRDGLCHEAVLWFAHHLPESARLALAKSPDFVLPLLPPHVHDTSDKTGKLERQFLLEEYRSKVSCQQCHTGPINNFSSDATLPQPLPADMSDPGLERLRVCDFQYEPGCGPCEGLGGPRTGDGVHEFTPMRCEVVAQPEVVPEKERIAPAYPEMGIASYTGEVRIPVAVDPMAHGKPGKYIPLQDTISLGWDQHVLRQRYDGETSSQIMLQTRDQQRRNETGIMVTIRNGTCQCTDAIAGNMHVQSFVKHEPLDPVDLPASEGGAAYLGRVRVQLGQNQTFLADHYMKWAFHILVDADDSSLSYGLPLRLYAPYGVRFEYSDWHVGDPSLTNPGVWDLPQDCEMLSDKCTLFLPSVLV